jgi:hypothetical protein
MTQLTHFYPISKTKILGELAFVQKIMQGRDLNFRQLETLKNYLVNVVNAGWTIDASSI